MRRHYCLKKKNLHPVECTASLSAHKISLKFYSGGIFILSCELRVNVHGVSFVSVLRSLEFFVSGASFEICKDGRTRGSSRVRRMWKDAFGAHTDIHLSVLHGTLTNELFLAMEFNCFLSSYQRPFVGKWLLFNVLDPECLKLKHL